MRTKLKIALHYAFWAGEPWSTPLGIREELLRRGHEVYDINLYHDNGAIIPNLKRRTNSIQGLTTFMNAVNRGQVEPDMFFHLDYGSFVHPALDRKYFNRDMFWVLECGDEPQSHRAQSAKIKTGWDLALSPDFPCVSLHQQRGYHCKWWTHFADHHIFKPYEDESLQWDVVTTCGGRAFTGKIQKKLKGRYHDGRYVWGEDYGRFLNRGKIVFQQSQFGEITRRVFEGMACRRMVITDRLAEGTHINSLFTEDEDIVYYSSADEAIEKINYYAAHDEERERIAENGYHKVLEAHTVKHRVDLIEKEYEAWKS